MFKFPKLNKKTVIVLVLIITLLFIDQLTKILVKTNMSIGESIMIFGEWFQIRFIENKGAAYGFEIGGYWGKLFLTLIRVVLIGFISYWIVKLIRKDVSTGVLVGVSLILCGAVGNVLDSMFYGVIFSESSVWQVADFVPISEGYSTWLHGSVVDMLYFPIINTTLPQWFPFWGGEPYTFFSPIFNLADTYINIGAIYLILFKRKVLFNS